MTENPAAFLVDFGVPMTFGAVVSKVIFDEVNAAAQFGGFAGKSISITYDPADFVGLDVGSHVTINAQLFEVMSPPEGDALLRVNLQKVTP
ncbi:hypothetical protein HQN60_12620 [Deefgea piscis]|uniref:Uncharacterized protein n=1 Tax=Deefgea piscis TaxID=2739061 RepID=A0A6M8SS22_9NEIS|nr:hypothetical protein [Deefgea piscis]QKJ67481.1 hypothetical protein HQN60_12620 [Deefgea piscis]